MSMLPTTVSAPDLTSPPGLHPCDKCERITPCEWFGSFWFCAECVLIAADALGKEAAARAIERLAEYHQLRVELRTRLTEQQKRTHDLLLQVGETGVCKGCAAAIIWIRHKPNRRHPQGALAPYDYDGVNHFVTCPQSAQFRKAKGA